MLSDAQRKAKNKYKRKIKTKNVSFYICDKKIYDYACSINFNREVKNWLMERMIENECK